MVNNTFTFLIKPQLNTDEVEQKLDTFVLGAKQKTKEIFSRDENGAISDLKTQNNKYRSLFGGAFDFIADYSKSTIDMLNSYSDRLLSIKRQLTESKTLALRTRLQDHFASQGRMMLASINDRLNNIGSANSFVNTVFSQMLSAIQVSLGNQLKRLRGSLGTLVNTVAGRHGKLGSYTDDKILLLIQTSASKNQDNVYNKVLQRLIASVGLSNIEIGSYGQHIIKGQKTKSGKQISVLDILSGYTKALIPTAVPLWRRRDYANRLGGNPFAARDRLFNSYTLMLPLRFRTIADRKPNAPVGQPGLIGQLARLDVTSLNDKMAKQTGPTKTNKQYITEEEADLLAKMMGNNPYLGNALVSSGIASKKNGVISLAQNSAGKALITRLQLNAAAGLLYEQIFYGANGSAQYGKSVFNNSDYYSIGRKNNHRLRGSLLAALWMSDKFGWLEPELYSENALAALRHSSFSGKPLYDVNDKYSSVIRSRVGNNRYDVATYTLSDLNAGNDYNNPKNWANYKQASDYHRTSIELSILVRKIVDKMNTSLGGKTKVSPNDFLDSIIILQNPELLSDPLVSNLKKQLIKNQIADYWDKGITKNGQHYQAYRMNKGSGMYFVRDDIRSSILKLTPYFFTGGMNPNQLFSSLKSFVAALDHINKTATQSQSIEESFGTDLKSLSKKDIILANWTLGLNTHRAVDNGQVLINSDYIRTGGQGRMFGGKMTLFPTNFGSISNDMVASLGSAGYIKNGKFEILDAFGQSQLVGLNTGMIIPVGLIKDFDTRFLKYITKDSDGQYHLAGSSLKLKNDNYNAIILQLKKDEQYLSIARTSKETAKPFNWLTYQSAQMMQMPTETRKNLLQYTLDQYEALRDSGKAAEILFSGNDMLSRMLKKNPELISTPLYTQRISLFQALILDNISKGNLLVPKLLEAQRAMAFANPADILASAAYDKYASGKSFDEFKKALPKDIQTLMTDENINLVIFQNLLSEKLGIGRSPYALGSIQTAQNKAINPIISTLMNKYGFDQNGILFNPASKMLAFLQSLDFDGDVNDIFSLKKNNADSNLTREAFNRIFTKAQQFSELSFKRVRLQQFDTKLKKDKDGMKAAMAQYDSDLTYRKQVDDNWDSYVKSRTHSVVTSSGDISNQGRTFKISQGKDVADALLLAQMASYSMGLPNAITRSAFGLDITNDSVARALVMAKEMYDVNSTLNKTSQQLLPDGELMNIAKMKPFALFFQKYDKSIGLDGTLDTLKLKQNFNPLNIFSIGFPRSTLAGTFGNAFLSRYFAKHLGYAPSLKTFDASYWMENIFQQGGYKKDLNSAFGRMQYALLQAYLPMLSGDSLLPSKDTANTLLLLRQLAVKLALRLYSGSGNNVSLSERKKAILKGGGNVISLLFNSYNSILNQEGFFELLYNLATLSNIDPDSVLFDISATDAYKEIAEKSNVHLDPLRFRRLQKRYNNYRTKSAPIRQEIFDQLKAYSKEDIEQFFATAGGDQNIYTDQNTRHNSLVFSPSLLHLIAQPYDLIGPYDWILKRLDPNRYQEIEMMRNHSASLIGKAAHEAILTYVKTNNADNALSAFLTYVNNHTKEIDTTDQDTVSKLNNIRTFIKPESVEGQQKRTLTILSLFGENGIFNGATLIGTLSTLSFDIGEKMNDRGVKMVGSQDLLFRDNVTGQLILGDVKNYNADKFKGSVNDQRYFENQMMTYAGGNIMLTKDLIAMIPQKRILLYEALALKGIIDSTQSLSEGNFVPLKLLTGLAMLADDIKNADIKGLNVEQLRTLFETDNNTLRASRIFKGAYAINPQILDLGGILSFDTSNLAIEEKGLANQQLIQAIVNTLTSAGINEQSLEAIRGLAISSQGYVPRNEDDYRALITSKVKQNVAQNQYLNSMSEFSKDTMTQALISHDVIQRLQLKLLKTNKSAYYLNKKYNEQPRNRWADMLDEFNDENWDHTLRQEGLTDLQIGILGVRRDQAKSNLLQGLLSNIEQLLRYNKAGDSLLGARYNKYRNKNIISQANNIALAFKDFDEKISAFDALEKYVNEYDSKTKGINDERLKAKQTQIDKKNKQIREREEQLQKDITDESSSDRDVSVPAKKRRKKYDLEIRQSKLELDILNKLLEMIKNNNEALDAQYKTAKTAVDSGKLYYEKLKSDRASYILNIKQSLMTSSSDDANSLFESMNGANIQLPKTIDQMRLDYMQRINGLILSIAELGNIKDANGNNIFSNDDIAKMKKPYELMLKEDAVQKYIQSQMLMGASQNEYIDNSLTSQENAYSANNASMRYRYSQSHLLNQYSGRLQARASASRQYALLSSQIDKLNRIKRALLERMSDTSLPYSLMRKYQKAYEQSSRKLDMLELQKNITGKLANKSDSRLAFESTVNSVLNGILRLSKSLSHRALTAAINSFKNFVKLFDASMTLIQMVTMKSDDQILALGTSFIKTARKMGVSTKEVTSAATIFYRQGLNDELVQDRMLTAIKFAKASGTSVSDASQLITAGVNTGLFNTAQDVSDVITALGDNAATNAKLLSKAIKKSGAAAANDGTTGALLSAMLTAMLSTTQLSGSVVGTTMNSVISRLNKLSTTEGSIIYDLNGNAISNSTVMSLLRSNGILTNDASGKQLSAYKILRSLGLNWNGLSDIAQQQIATALGGTRAYSNLSALMAGFSSDDGQSIIDQYLTLALNSSGITNTKFSAYSLSLTAALSNLSTSFDQLWNSLSDSNTMTGFIDGISSLVDGLSYLALQGNATIPAITTILSILGVLSSGIVGGLPGLAIAAGSLLVGGISISRASDSAKNKYYESEEGILLKAYLSYNSYAKINKTIIDQKKSEISLAQLIVSNSKNNKTITLSDLAKLSGYLKRLNIGTDDNEIRKFIDDPSVVNLNSALDAITNALSSAATSITLLEKKLKQNSALNSIDSVIPQISKAYLSRSTTGVVSQGSTLGIIKDILDMQNTLLITLVGTSESRVSGMNLIASNSTTSDTSYASNVSLLDQIYDYYYNKKDRAKAFLLYSLLNTEVDFSLYIESIKNRYRQPNINTKLNDNSYILEALEEEDKTIEQILALFGILQPGALGYDPNNQTGSLAYEDTWLNGYFTNGQNIISINPYAIKDNNKFKSFLTALRSKYTNQSGMIDVQKYRNVSDMLSKDNIVSNFKYLALNDIGNLLNVSLFAEFFNSNRKENLNSGDFISRLTFDDIYSLLNKDNVFDWFSLYIKSRLLNDNTYYDYLMSNDVLSLMFYGSGNNVHASKMLFSRIVADDLYKALGYNSYSELLNAIYKSPLNVAKNYNQYHEQLNDNKSFDYESISDNTSGDISTGYKINWGSAYNSYTLPTGSNYQKYIADSLSSTISKGYYIKNIGSKLLPKYARQYIGKNINGIYLAAMDGKLPYLNTFLLNNAAIAKNLIDAGIVSYDEDEKKYSIQSGLDTLNNLYYKSLINAMYSASTGYQALGKLTNKQQVENIRSYIGTSGQFNKEFSKMDLDTQSAIASIFADEKDILSAIQNKTMLDDNQQKRVATILNNWYNKRESTSQLNIALAKKIQNGIINGVNLGDAITEIGDASLSSVLSSVDGLSNLYYAQQLILQSLQKTDPTATFKLSDITDGNFSNYSNTLSKFGIYSYSDLQKQIKSSLLSSWFNTSLYVNSPYANQIKSTLTNINQGGQFLQQEMQTVNNASVNKGQYMTALRRFRNGKATSSDISTIASYSGFSAALLLKRYYSGDYSYYDILASGNLALAQYIDSALALYSKTNRTKLLDEALSNYKKYGWFDEIGKYTLNATYSLLTSTLQIQKLNLQKDLQNKAWLDIANGDYNSVNVSQSGILQDSRLQAYIANKDIDGMKLYGALMSKAYTSNKNKALSSMSQILGTTDTQFPTDWTSLYNKIIELSSSTNLDDKTKLSNIASAFGISNISAIAEQGLNAFSQSMNNAVKGFVDLLFVAKYGADPLYKLLSSAYANITSLRKTDRTSQVNNWLQQRTSFENAYYALNEAKSGTATSSVVSTLASATGFSLKKIRLAISNGDMNLILSAVNDSVSLLNSIIGTLVKLSLGKAGRSIENISSMSGQQIYSAIEGINKLLADWILSIGGYIKDGNFVSNLTPTKDSINANESYLGYISDSKLQAKYRSFLTMGERFFNNEEYRDVGYLDYYNSKYKKGKQDISALFVQYDDQYEKVKSGLKSLFMQLADALGIDFSNLPLQYKTMYDLLDYFGSGYITYDQAGILSSYYSTGNDSVNRNLVMQNLINSMLESGQSYGLISGTTYGQFLLAYANEMLNKGALARGLDNAFTFNDLFTDDAVKAKKAMDDLTTGIALSNVSLLKFGSNSSKVQNTMKAIATGGATAKKLLVSLSAGIRALGNQQYDLTNDNKKGKFTNAQKNLAKNILGLSDKDIKNALQAGLQAILQIKDAMESKISEDAKAEGKSLLSALYTLFNAQTGQNEELFTQIIKLNVDALSGLLNLAGMISALALAGMVVNLAFTAAVMAWAQSAHVKINVDGTTLEDILALVVPEGTSGSGGGGGGGGGKSAAQKLVLLILNKSALYEHLQKMVQKRAKLQQSQGKLSSYSISIQLENKVIQDYQKHLKESIALLKKQLKATSETSDDYQTLSKLIMKCEEAYADLNQQLLDNRKLLIENEKAIYELRTSLEDTARLTFENFVQAERDMLSGATDMLTQILDIIKNRYQEEWDLIKQDIEKKKQALQELMSLIDERLQAKKQASLALAKYQKIALLLAQLALVSMDATRTAEANDIRKQIQDLYKEVYNDQMTSLALAQKNMLQDSIDSLDNYQQQGDLDMLKLLENANNFADEVTQILGMSYLDLMNWLKNNNEEYLNSLLNTMLQTANSWTDTYKQMMGITDTYNEEVNAILGSKETFMAFMLSTKDYQDATVARQQLMRLEWELAYRDYQNWLNDNENTEKYKHKDGSVGIDGVGIYSKISSYVNSAISDAQVAGVYSALLSAGLDISKIKVASSIDTTDWNMNSSTDLQALLNNISNSLNLTAGLLTNTTKTLEQTISFGDININANSINDNLDLLSVASTLGLMFAKLISKQGTNITNGYF